MIKVVLFVSFVAVATARLSEIIGPPEYGDHFEGDMIMTQEQKDNLFSPERNEQIEQSYRWPNRIVPYVMSKGHIKEQQDYIEQALKKFEQVTCIKFEPRTNEDDYIQITALGGCYAQVGYQKGAQILNLQASPVESGCFRMGTITHQFLHALGFYHMQNVHDRDNYLKIHTENMPEWARSNFNKYGNSNVSHYGAPYDYISVMHFSAYAFSNNGLPTIETIKDQSFASKMGQRVGMTSKDIYKVNKFYECGQDTMTIETTDETGKRGLRIDKPYLIRQCIGAISNNLLTGITEAQLENEGIPALLDLVIKAYKTHMERNPDEAESVQKHIDFFEDEKTRL